MVFAETVNSYNEALDSKEIWNWIENVYQQYPYNSSKGQYSHHLLDNYSSGSRNNMIPQSQDILNKKGHVNC